MEEPTSPDDILGHARIAREVAPVRIATGEHCHNRTMFKQLMQAGGLGVCQLDACRLGGVNEVLAVLLLAARFEIPVCPHAGGVGLSEYVQHLSLVDYIAVGGDVSDRVIEYVDELHEHFVAPVEIRGGRYVTPEMPWVQHRDASRIARRVRVPRRRRVELVTLIGSRLVRVRDGDGDVHVGVVREAELTVLNDDDMLGTLERGELPDALETVPVLDAETTRAARAVGAAGSGARARDLGRGRHLRAQPLGSHAREQGRRRVRARVRRGAARAVLEGRRRDGARSDRARRSPRAATRRGRCPSPSWPWCWAPAGPLAVTIGNDVSSRDIEGANPLYLPQAKIYDRACALGPALLVPDSWDAHYQIDCRILDSDGAELFAEETSTESMRRSIDELDRVPAARQSGARG